MSIWLVRIGSKGQCEDEFLSDKSIYITWGKHIYNEHIIGKS